MEEPSVLDYVKARLALLSSRGNDRAEQRLLEIQLAAGLLAPDSDGAQPELAAPAAAGESRVAGRQDFSAVGAARAEAGTELSGLLSPAPSPAPSALAHAAAAARPTVEAGVLPLRTLAALALALVAQLALEPPARSTSAGLVLYLLAGAFALWAYAVGEWRLAEGAASVQPGPAGSAGRAVLVVNSMSLTIAVPLLFLAFYLFHGNRFTLLNVLVWAAGLFFLIRAMWQPEPRRASWRDRLAGFAARPEWNLRVTRWTLLALAAAAVAVFFRFYRLSSLPPEMISDHAEKLLDVWDVLAGQTSIFFPRNTGREALQMYLTAAIARYLGTGISYLSLKIGTALAGLLTLPYIYLLGKEVGGRRVGLLAFLLAGIAYWPNVISRVGLRFPLYPLFVAPVLYYLVRGLNRSSFNDFILAGVALGIGLHGYTPIRIVPFVAAAAVGLFAVQALFRKEAQRAQQAVIGLALVGLVSLALFLPLLRTALEMPELFAFRSFSRLGSVERALPGPAWQIFLSNLWRAGLAPIWDDGEIWVTSVTHRPALDFVQAALYGLGSLLLLLRFIRRRSWLDLFLLLSVPLLMMPSILSLAFPDENPSLNRMAGAIVPIFLIAGLALDGLISAFERQRRAPGDQLAGASPAGASAAGAPAAQPVVSGLPRLAQASVVGLLLLFTIWQNYGLVFDEYDTVYLNSSWNSSEMGQVIAQFTHTVGREENAWVVAFPYWVDTRLVGMNAGYPLRDFAIWPEDFGTTQAFPGPKLFLIRPDDTAGLEKLQALYPQGALQEYVSRVENHNFYIFYVPG